MQLLTVSQVLQVRMTASAAYTALQIVEDATCSVLDRTLCAATSDRAIAAYKLVGKVIYHSIMLTAAAAFFAGVLTRQLWNRFTRWADRFVADCESSATAPVLVLAAAPVAVEEDVWAEVPRTLVTPPTYFEFVRSLELLPALPPATEPTAAIEVAQPQAKTRSRKNTSATTKTTRKTGGKAKTKVEKVKS